MKRSLRIGAPSIMIGFIALACGMGCGSTPSEQTAQGSEALTFGGQVVVDWNAIMITEIGKNVPLVSRRSRMAAVVSVAVYEAVNSVYGDYEPYLAKIATPHGTNAEAAALAAAHRALVSLFPVDQADLDAQYTTALAAIPNGGKADGVTLGEAAANSILTLRANDGFDRVLAWGPDDPLWTPATGLGVWVPTPPAFANMAEAHWPFVTTWSLPKASEYRVGPPLAISSAEYAVNYNAVKSLGDINSTTRTADQTDSANFWFDPTIFPWNMAARQATQQRRMSIEETAHTIALLNIGLADAQIAVYDSKEYWATDPGFSSWRPITQIQQGDNDGNPDTVGDPNWLPLRTTPAHPDYPSGHATQSGAGAIILNYIFDGEEHRHHSSFNLDLLSAAGRGQVPPIERKFTTFDQMTQEVVGARVWAGIHTPHADDVGVDLGQHVAHYVIGHSLLRAGCHENHGWGDHDRVER